MSLGDGKPERARCWEHCGLSPYPPSPSLSQSHIQSISKRNCLLLRNIISHVLHCCRPSPSHQHILFWIINHLSASLPSLSHKSICHTAAKVILLNQTSDYISSIRNFPIIFHHSQSKIQRLYGDVKYLHDTVLCDWNTLPQILTWLIPSPPLCLYTKATFSVETSLTTLYIIVPYSCLSLSSYQLYSSSWPLAPFAVNAFISVWSIFLL